MAPTLDGKASLDADRSIALESLRDFALNELARDDQLLDRAKAALVGLRRFRRPPEDDGGDAFLRSWFRGFCAAEGIPAELLDFVFESARRGSWLRTLSTQSAAGVRAGQPSSDTCAANPAAVTIEDTYGYHRRDPTRFPHTACIRFGSFAELEDIRREFKQHRESLLADPPGRDKPRWTVEEWTLARRVRNALVAQVMNHGIPFRAGRTNISALARSLHAELCPRAQHSHLDDRRRNPKKYRSDDHCQTFRLDTLRKQLQRDPVCRELMRPESWDEGPRFGSQHEHLAPRDDDGRHQGGRHAT